MRFGAWLGGGLAVAVGVGLAVARPGGRHAAPERPHRPGPPLVAIIDTDRDGVLSADEIENAGASLLTLDADGDGALAPEELRAACGRDGSRCPPPPGFHDVPPPNGDDNPPPHGLLRHDADGDGVVSLDEFLGPAIEHFNHLDGNADGVIDEEEAHKAPPPPHERFHSRPNGGRGF